MIDQDNKSIVPISNSPLPMAIDDYSDLQLSSAAKERLAIMMMAARAGTVAMSPLICRGSNCKFLNRCPICLADGNNASFPIDRQCIVEVNFLNDRYLAYVDELDKFGEMQESMTFRTQVARLAALDLYELRQHMILAGVTEESDGTLLINQTIAITQHEDEVVQKQEHPSWGILSKIHKDRMELLDAMGLTKKRAAMIAAALKTGTTKNAITDTMELLESVGRLVEALDRDR